MGNSSSSGDDGADPLKTRHWTHGQRFLFALMWILLALTAMICIWALVEGIRLYDTENSVNSDLKNLTSTLDAASLLSSPCFTCDVKTGDMTFNSTIDVLYSTVASRSHFEGPKLGMNLPGYSFYNSPMITDGWPLVTSDMIIAPGSNLNQMSVGLPNFDGASSNQNPASPMGFGYHYSTSSPFSKATTYSSLRIGMFKLSAYPMESTRCKSSEMTSSPSVYILQDDSSMVSSVYKLCICVTSNSNAGASGAGEHCSTGEFTAAYFPV